MREGIKEGNELQHLQHEKLKTQWRVTYENKKWCRIPTSRYQASTTTPNTYIHTIMFTQGSKASVF